MGNNPSAFTDRGYTVISKQGNTTLVKNKAGDQFGIKKLRADQEEESNILLQLSHPHIVDYKEIFRDGSYVYLVLEHCEGRDLAQKINHRKTEITAIEILDWIVMICMALKYLHDRNILHKNLHQESIFFTACGTIRLGEFGAIIEGSCNRQRMVAPEISRGRPYDEKSEIWSLGNLIEKSMQNCETFSEDLRQLAIDTLQNDPAERPSVSNILTRPFIINQLCEKSTQTVEELYETLKELRALADDLERVHFNTTVSSLTGGVVGLAGGITSVVGLILSPFTLGASLIVTGVGIGTAVAGGVTAGASNITNMVNQRTNRQNIKMLIKKFQEKIASTVCCLQNIQIAVETLENQFSTSGDAFLNAQPGANAGARLGRGLGGIPELLRLVEVVNVGRVAAQAARAIRVAEAATGVLSALFVAVDIFFVFLDSREIHNIRQDYALRESRQESGATDQTSNNSGTTNLLPSNSQQAEELKSETMKFVTKIRETADELKTVLDTVRDAIPA